MQAEVSPLPVELGGMLNFCPNRRHLWSEKRNRTLKMKHFLSQLPSILVIYCICMLQISSSGFPQPLTDPPDGLDIVQLEQLAYYLSQWATLPSQPKVNQDICKRFLFHYSRFQEPRHRVKTGFPPVRPLMHLAAKLANRRMKRDLRRGQGTAGVDFTKKDYAAILGRPFFLFRPRNGRNTEDNVQ